MLHECATCRPGALRVIDHARGVVRIPTRFRGPPNSGNGGVAAGLFACIGSGTLGEPCRRLNVRLHLPPPLEADLPFSTSVDPDDPRRLRVKIVAPDGEIVLSGWVSAERDPVMPSSTAELLASAAAPDSRQMARFDAHVETPNAAAAAFGGCFVCGPDAPGGLALRPRPLTDELRWTPWHPHSDWDDDGGLSMLPAIAALDCTAALGLNDRGFLAEHEALLLGTYDADIIERPVGADATDLRVVTRARGRDGRKIWTDIGLFTPDGRPMVLGLGTWIVVSPEVAAGTP